MVTGNIPQHIRTYIDYTVKEAVSRAIEKLSENTGSTNVINDEFISAEQTARLLKIKLSTLYAKVEAGELPHYRSGKRKLLFAKAELLTYISNHRYKSNKEISQEAENYVNSKNI